MIKRNITYEDFNIPPNLVTESFYFHLSKAELLELEVSYEGGLGATMERIIDSKDNKSLLAEFKKLILLSYGVRSENGKAFIKSEQLRDEFSQTAAYQTLFMELATNSGAAAEFINGIVPKDMVSAMNQNQAIEVLPPPTS